MNDINLGVNKGNKKETDEYETYFNGDIEIGQKMKGEVYITEKTMHEESGKPKFSVIINDHDLEETYVLTYFGASFFEEDTVLYGKQGSKVYNLLDPIISQIYDQEPDVEKYRSVEFETFRDAINQKVQSIEVEALEPTHALAKNPLFHVTNVVLFPSEEE